MIGEFDVDKMIEEAIQSLISDTPKQAAECLQELAKTWAGAGFTKQSFMEMRQHIVLMAESKTDAAFVREKLRIAEQDLMKGRTGSIIIH